ncbi:fatty acid elongase [Angomonas deanei]|nr:fatty acid elongase [Angomonas deanei]|eukprot:EPY42825.1 fatty acid elongase [Angomonas deanei]
MYPWIEPFTGTDVRVWMGNNVDVCAVLCFLYLGMIRYGPNICKSVFGEKGNSPDPAWLRYAMVLWNLFLSAFSCSGMIVMVPALIKQFAKDGWHNTLCIHHDELLYSTTVGFWTGLFALSKIFELIDTVFLVLQKQKLPPFLHWYHHVSVLIFSWMSYTVGNSTMAIFAAMNITVHTIMYFYFCRVRHGPEAYCAPLRQVHHHDSDLADGGRLCRDLLQLCRQFPVLPERHRRRQQAPLRCEQGHRPLRFHHVPLVPVPV